MVFNDSLIIEQHFDPIRTELSASLLEVCCRVCIGCTSSSRGCNSCRSHQSNNYLFKIYQLHPTLKYNVCVHLSLQNYRGPRGNIRDWTLWLKSFSLSTFVCFCMSLYVCTCCGGGSFVCVCAHVNLRQAQTHRDFPCLTYLAGDRCARLC